jgi:hypothetical protein
MVAVCVDGHHGVMAIASDLGPRVGEDGVRSAVRPGARVPDDGARFELACSGCGYGVVVRIAPDRCPMCQGTVWEHVSALTGKPARRAA